jgi:hypothetical protein
MNYIYIIFSLIIKFENRFRFKAINNNFNISYIKGLYRN